MVVGNELPALSDWFSKGLQDRSRTAEDHLMFRRVERLLNASKAVLEGAQTIEFLRTCVNAIEKNAIVPTDQSSML